MPHLKLEINQSLTDRETAHELLKTVHLDLIQIGQIDASRLKSRLVSTSNVLNGNDGKSLDMIHVELAVLSGRPLETRKSLGTVIQESVHDFLKNKAIQNVAVTVEIREMDTLTYLK